MALSQGSKQGSQVSVPIAAPSGEGRVRLGYLLHSSLDFQVIMQRFFEGIQQEGIPLNSISYQHELENIEINIGPETSHKCRYHLRTLEQDFGIVELTRDEQFNDDEIKAVENILSLLLSPLQNALQFHQVHQAALQDPLTGLGNRAALDSILHRDLELAKRHNAPIAVLALDIDHFKQINDTYGHLVGDQVLQLFSDNIKEAIRESDVAFRSGGEEFIILLNKTDLDGAKLLAERIREKIAGIEYRVNDNNVMPTVSIGVAPFNGEDGVNGLLARADQALYAAKNNGRNQVSV